MSLCTSSSSGSSKSIPLPIPRSHFVQSRGSLQESPILSDDSPAWRFPYGLSGNESGDRSTHFSARHSETRFIHDPSPARTRSDLPEYSAHRRHGQWSHSSWVQSYTRTMTFVSHQSFQSLPDTCRDLECFSDQDNDKESEWEHPDRSFNLPSESLEEQTPLLSHAGKPHCRGSTLAQSCFNTVNLLVGIGFLSLPYAIRLSGWIPGLLLLITVAAITNYTGLLVARVLQVSGSRSYSELAEKAFGPNVRACVSILFLTELYVTCVAFVILTTDSLAIIMPSVNVQYFRTFVLVICTALCCVSQLKYISYASLVGVFASINLVIVVLINGFVTTTSPGSILSPAPTQLLPSAPLSISISFGIIMAGFAGHAVLPSIYIDMRRPSQYPLALNISFGIAVGFYIIMAVSGYLMFGDTTLEEVTKNLQQTDGWMGWLNFGTAWLICFIPIPKYALTMAPVASTVDAIISATLIKSSKSAPSFDSQHKSSFLMKLFIRFLLVSGTTLIPSLFPHFDLILSLIGTVFSVLVSIVLPVLFYDRICGKSIWGRIIRFVIVIGAAVMAGNATWISMLPQARPGISV